MSRHFLAGSNLIILLEGSTQRFCPNRSTNAGRLPLHFGRVGLRLVIVDCAGLEREWNILAQQRSLGVFSHGTRLRSRSRDRFRSRFRGADSGVGWRRFCGSFGSGRGFGAVSEANSRAREFQSKVWRSFAASLQIRRHADM